ncbi:MAG: Serine hydroxymethyltransferase, cytosolic [Watsoniomyces obsoletus]|nr:MAG: Serine hydroxymethyltransferase, cytosolic [Watsoniomyces obsoletus]
MSVRKETPIFPPGFIAPPTSTTQSTKVASKPAETAALGGEIVIDTDSSSGYSSTSASSSEDEGNEGTRNETSTRPHTPPEPRSIQARPAVAFKPPAGFQPVSVPKSGASTTSELFSDSNPGGKQLWHITVPGSVPIELISGVLMEDLSNGQATVTHSEVEYRLALESEPTQTAQLLLPAANRYRTASSPFTKTLQFRRVPGPVPLAPPIPQQNGSRGANPAAIPPRTVRMQPKGLKMRYRPFGWRRSQSDDEDSSDDEAEVVRDGHINPEPDSQFRLPRGFEEMQVSWQPSMADASGASQGTHIGSLVNLDEAHQPIQKNKRRHDEDDAVDAGQEQAKIDILGGPVEERRGHRRETSTERAERKRRKHERKEKRKERESRGIAEV